MTSRAATPERHRQIQALFAAAVERPAAERAALLDAACEGDAGLRAEVEALLAAEADAPAILGAALSELAVVLPDATPRTAGAAAPLADRAIGPYRLLREIGRGGMGTVYLAERDDLARRVALKLVRDPLAAPEHVDRFLVERRVLARLDHPNVARLLDAGVTDEGTPWFAMEYVAGRPIDVHCDGHRRTIDERLALFRSVCDAVAYAHRNLVVHRDLKPSNVLVTADGTVKLLDFGIAKLLGVDEGAPAPRTRTAARLLTPEYAAPEQVRGDPVTTATDVYGLGVLLFELLAGCRPYRTTGGSLAELERAVLDSAPIRPSVAAVRADGHVGFDAPRGRATPGEVAAARRLTPGGLARRLAGDLDTIVGKALDKVPERRYASAEQLGDDIGRHLAGHPVVARPASWGYRARTFVRRHRWAVAGAAGVFALLVGTAAGMTVLQARTARAQARTARALAQATAEADKARQVTQLVTTLFQSSDPYQTAIPTGAPTGEADALLALGAERLERELGAQPAVRAELLHVLGVVARNRGRYDAADTLLRRALAARRAPSGTDAGFTAASSDAGAAGLLHDLGVVRRAMSDYGGADTLLTRALAMRQELAGRARLPGGDAVLEATRFELGVLRRMQGRYVEAERLLEPVLATHRRTPGPRSADLLEELAHVRMVQEDADSAVALMQQVVALRARWHDRGHPAVARAYYRLATMLRNTGRMGDAEHAARQALALLQGRLPADHPEVLAAEHELSWDLLEQGSYDEAEGVIRRVLAARRRLYGDVHRDVGAGWFVLGVIQYRRGDPRAAAVTFRRSTGTFAQVEGAGHPELNQSREKLALAEFVQGNEAEALALVAQILRARGRPVWDGTAQPLDALGTMFRSEADCRRAVPLHRRALAAYVARHPIAARDDTLLIRLRARAATCAAEGPLARRR